MWLLLPLSCQNLLKLLLLQGLHILAGSLVGRQLLLSSLLLLPGCQLLLSSQLLLPGCQLLLLLLSGCCKLLYRLSCRLLWKFFNLLREKKFFPLYY
jgi:hypothetical protein